MEEPPITGHWTKHQGAWLISAVEDLPKNTEVEVFKKSGASAGVYRLQKQVGQNEYGGIYSFERAPLKDFSMWVTHGEHGYVLLVPDGAKRGDVVIVKKKDQTRVEKTLNVHIDGNYWFCKEQQAECDSCGEKGSKGEVCNMCNTGHYLY